jgi:pilus assembly protein CpaB
MRVDVLISGNPPGSTGMVGTLTRTLLQDVEVLSAGQEFKKDAEGKPLPVQVINLLVSPEDAEKLSLAAGQTTIQLVLRNPMDRERSNTRGVAMSNLFSDTVLRRATPARMENDAGAEQPAQPRKKVVRPAPSVPPAAAPKVEAKEPPKGPFVMEIILGNKRTESRLDRAGEAKP